MQPGILKCRHLRPDDVYYTNKNTRPRTLLSIEKVGTARYKLVARRKYSFPAVGIHKEEEIEEELSHSTHIFLADEDEHKQRWEECAEIEKDWPSYEERKVQWLTTLTRKRFLAAMMRRGEPEAAEVLSKFWDEPIPEDTNFNEAEDKTWQ